MEVAVFGTGYVYRKYKNKIPCKICCLVDNASDKQGSMTDGIQVIPPEKLCGYDYTYIVIMTFRYEEIEQQLLKMGIPEEKILNYTHIAAIQHDYPQVHVNGGMEQPEKWLDANRERKRVLLVSHDFSYTGVPVALLNMALVLKKMEYAVMMAGLTDGRFTDELEKQDIAYLDEINTCYGTEWFGRMAAGFDYIVAGTLALDKFVHRCRLLPVRILWWLHESDSAMYDGINLSWLTGNVKIYGGGKRVMDTFKIRYADRTIEKLLYCIPKTKASSRQKDTDSDKVIFALIGTISYRKAQDIVLGAIQNMPRRYRRHFCCLIVGAPSGIEHNYCEEIKRKVLDIGEIKMIGEVDQEQLDKMFCDIDVLLCPSRDDPMPIVVTQAMMHGRLCIISENVGQAEYIRQGENGFLFKNENTEDLTGYMMWAMEHKDMLCQLGERSRKIYENMFSPVAMEQNIRSIFDGWDNKEIPI